VGDYAYLGKGFDYPFEFTAGTVATAEELESINASLFLIFTTRPGELFMSPHIGSRLWELVFKPIDAVFYSLAEQYLKDAIRKQEPRIKNVSLSFKTLDSDPNKVSIAVAYTVVQTSVKSSFSYLFDAQGGV